MKLLISFISIVMFLFTSVDIAYAATTVTTVTTVTKATATKRAHHHKRHYPCHYKKHKKKVHKIVEPIRVYYSPAYCESNPCSCSGTSCYPARCYHCKTDYYYNDGRNSARVEVCY